MQLAGETNKRVAGRDWSQKQKNSHERPSLLDIGAAASQQPVVYLKMKTFKNWKTIEKKIKNIWNLKKHFNKKFLHLQCHVERKGATLCSFGETIVF